MTKKRLFCFGFGYTATFLAEALQAQGWSVAGTTTSARKRDFMRQQGVDAFLLDRNRPLDDPRKALTDATHVLLSIPPNPEGDTVFAAHGGDLVTIPKKLEWVGYLSATAVYGNQDGAWVTEQTPAAPASRRGSLRLKAEEQWQSLYLNEGLPLHIFRLAGVYGPGRSAVDAVRSGYETRCVDKPGHAFNRIHIDDVVQTLIASINKPNPGAIYNVADDEPTTSYEVIRFACNLLGVDTPPLVPYDQAELAPIVRSFYKDNKRVRNDLIKSELGVTLHYPDYRSGLQACLAVEQEAADILKFTTGAEPEN